MISNKLHCKLPVSKKKLNQLKKNCIPQAHNSDICLYIYFSRSPISVAAAAIYMASQASADKKNQKGKEK